MAYTSNYLYHELKLNPTSLITYPTFYHFSGNSFCNATSFKTEKEVKQSYLGQVNKKSSSKIIRAINLLWDISTRQYFNNPTTNKKNYFKLNFITLTLSSAQAQVKDKIIVKECFQWFLAKCRSKFGLKSYVWKAERQKNGNIHFHITTNCYIRHNHIREVWNNAQERIGFLDLFEKKWHHRNPNSTDVKVVKNKKDLAVYLAKYVSKVAQDGSKIGGKVWDCSLNLKRVKCSSLELVGSLASEVDEILNKNKYSVVKKDYIDIFVLDSLRTKNILTPLINQHYGSFLQQVKNFKRDNNTSKSKMDTTKSGEKKEISETYKQKNAIAKRSRRLPSNRQLSFISSL